MGQTTRTWLIASMVALLCLLAINAGVGYQTIRQVREESRMVSHTHEVLQSIEALVANVSDAETGQRGYLLTNDESYLEPYQGALTREKNNIDRIARLTSDNARQVEQLPRLRALVDQRMRILEQGMTLQREGDHDGAVRHVAGGEGKRVMDGIRDLADTMQIEESRLLAERRGDSARAYRLAVTTVFAGAGLALVALGGFIALLRKHLRSLDESAREIQLQRELLRATLTSIGDGVIATDVSGRVTFMNQVAQSLTGWTEDEARGVSLVTVFQIINEDTRQAVDNPAVRACREGKIVGLANHTLLLSRDGSEWPIDDSAAPIRIAGNEVSGAVLVFREIKQRKLHETELRRQADALKDADRRKDEFLATLAHELRNPLAPISNALQLWPMMVENREEMERLRGMMSRQVRQITRLIDDLLDVSRISRGRVLLQRQRVDLAVALAEAVEATQPLIGAHDHRLAVELPERPVFVDGDVARLTQVFGNILHNAAKYTAAGGQIAISLAVQDGQARVAIRDNGAGIPPEMLVNIFEPFKQVHRTLDRSYGGLGIGLTLVKQLIELHGGTVEAHSDGVGQGSEFVVKLPLAADAPQGEASGARTLRDAIRDIPSHRVLVVDDVQASVTTLAMMLRAIGQQVSVANDGVSALELAARERPDVVILDIAMPGMDGYEVARRMRAAEPANGVTLVALTGYGQEEDRKRAIDAGFNRHMTKPASIEQLAQLLATLPASPAREA